jgi:hypothetical protein
MSKLNAENTITRLESAGKVLLSLPDLDRSNKLRTTTSRFFVMPMENCGYSSKKIHMTIEPNEIDAMDEAFTWLNYIPTDRYVLRRIVGARSLVSPLTGKHLYSWRRLGNLLGCDHKAVQRWYKQGIDLIVSQHKVNV